MKQEIFEAIEKELEPKTFDVNKLHEIARKYGLNVEIKILKNSPYFSICGTDLWLKIVDYETFEEVCKTVIVFV